MKLKSLLLLGGAAGAVAAVIKRRGGDQITQAASSAVAAAPQPVRDAAQSAAATVQQAVDKVTPGDGGGGTESQERYEPPGEALAQQPTEAGGTPSDDVPVRASGTADQLNVATHDAPEGAVMPDTSADDPLVREQEKAAEGDAAAIGGNAGGDLDPAMRPVVEGAGDENEETFEAREGLERSHRETET